MVGSVGNLLILISFAACGAATWFYFQAARTGINASELERTRRRLRGRRAWYLSLGAVTLASFALQYLILSHQFQYNYVYNYTSLDLPFFYTFSAFWAGQEGSFLLWILFNGLVGLGLILRSGEFESSVMAIVGLCQLFLLSMVLGIDTGIVSLGASPFLTLAEKFPDAAALQQPGYIPADGQGLNDLLQNPWMVIHPPVLFVGFAAMLAPFALVAAGLWQRRYTQWTALALPWALFANLTLMAGIALGGYWAYGTLSFGGYWAWDPVENTSLVPWLISVGALHAMIAHRKSGTNQKAALLLNLAAFILVIYSTFLTRSGVLSDMSVHSFTDLGLYNQLLLWILTMTAVGFGLYVRHRRHLPVLEGETQVLSRGFLLFSGAVLLAAYGVMILVGTSAPILGRFFQENPSAVAIAFYNQWSVPLVAGIAFLVGLAQLVWWKNMTRQQVNDAVFTPMLISTVCTAAILLFTPFVETVVRVGVKPENTAVSAMRQSGMFDTLGFYWETTGQGLLFVLLLFSAFFALISSGVVLWKIGRGNARMIGGAITHAGFLLMVLGILASSVFNNGLSVEASRTPGKESFVIEENTTRTVEGYLVSYTGKETSEKGRTTYRLQFEDPKGRQFEVGPVAYQNRRGQWVQNPDTRSFLEKDLFVAVSPRAMLQGESTGGGEGELVLARGDSAILGDGQYQVRVNGFDLNVDHPEVPDSASIVVAAVLEVKDLTSGAREVVRPIYYMGNAHGKVEHIPAEIDAWDLSFTLVGMQADGGGTVRLRIDGVEVRERDWIVVQAYEKPFINVLWFGLTLMLGGFGIAMYRRVSDDRVRKDREMVEEG